MGGIVVDVPRLPPPHFNIDVDGIRRAVLDHKPKLLFLTSPNNPDGGVLSSADLDVLLELPVLVVLDEAYVEFSGIITSRIADVPKRDNLIVLRTFSKRAALAGKCVSSTHCSSARSIAVQTQNTNSAFNYCIPSGMRVGYGAFPKGIIEYLWRAKQPYNVSVAAEVAACAALSNPQYLQVCSHTGSTVRITKLIFVFHHRWSKSC